jgi:hypothetical protein
MSIKRPRKLKKLSKINLLRIDFSFRLVVPQNFAFNEKKYRLGWKFALKATLIAVFN